MRGEFCLEFRCRRCDTENVHQYRVDLKRNNAVPERIKCTKCQQSYRFDDLHQAEGTAFRLSFDCPACGKTSNVPNTQVQMGFDKDGDEAVNVPETLQCALCGSGGKV